MGELPPEEIQVEANNVVQDELVAANPGFEMIPGVAVDDQDDGLAEHEPDGSMCFQ